MMKKATSYLQIFCLCAGLGMSQGFHAALEISEISVQKIRIKPTITINNPEATTDAQGKTVLKKTYGDDDFTITARSDGGSETLIYKSRNTNVATISETTGEVSILKAGEAIIEISKAAQKLDRTDITDDEFLASKKEIILQVQKRPLKLHSDQGAIKAPVGAKIHWFVKLIDEAGKSSKSHPMIQYSSGNEAVKYFGPISGGAQFIVRKATPEPITLMAKVIDDNHDVQPIQRLVNETQKQNTILDISLDRENLAANTDESVTVDPDGSMIAIKAGTKAILSGNNIEGQACFPLRVTDSSKVGAEIIAYEVSSPTKINLIRRPASNKFANYNICVAGIGRHAISFTRPELEDYRKASAKVAIQVLENPTSPKLVVSNLAIPAPESADHTIDLAALLKDKRKLSSLSSGGFTFSSSNLNVLSMNANQTIATVKNPGKTTITVKQAAFFQLYKEAEATFELTVNPAPVLEIKDALGKVLQNNDSIEISADNEETLPWVAKHLIDGRSMPGQLTLHSDLNNSIGLITVSQNASGIVIKSLNTRVGKTNLVVSFQPNDPDYPKVVRTFEVDVQAVSPVLRTFDSAIEYPGNNGKINLEERLRKDHRLWTLSPGALTFSAIPGQNGVLNIENEKFASVTKPGKFSIKVTQAASGPYKSAESNFTLTITKAKLSASWHITTNVVKSKITVLAAVKEHRIEGPAVSGTWSYHPAVFDMKDATYRDGTLQQDITATFTPDESDLYDEITIKKTFVVKADHHYSLAKAQRVDDATTQRMAGKYIRLETGALSSNDLQMKAVCGNINRYYRAPGSFTACADLKYFWHDNNENIEMFWDD